MEIRIHPYVFQEANIFSAYNLCSHLPFEELTVTLTSAYSVSVLVAEVVSSLEAAVTFLATVQNPAVVASPTSVYSLATAVT